MTGHIKENTLDGTQSLVTMLGLILALSVFLTADGSRHLQYELDFVTGKTYIFDYEGLVFTGLQERGFAKSAVKLKCRTEISGVAPRLRFLKVRNIELQEYSGAWPTNGFTTSNKLSELLRNQLAKPIMFEYNRGQVGDLHIPSGLSQTTVNLLRGIIHILQLTIREDQNIYILNENGIGGLCHNHYLIQEDQKANQLLITKSIDLNECEHREQMVIGNAYLHTCSNCKQRNKNSRAAATYNYKIKGTEMGGRLLEAEVREIHQFTPFNEIEGSVVVEARQRLVLQAVQELIHSTPENNDYISKESLRYHFERKLIQTPIHLLRTKNTESQITELLHHLVQHNVGPLSKVSPQKFVELVHLLRMSNYEDIESLWKQSSGRTHYRRWFLDAVPSIANHFALKFLKVTLKELSEFEAAQSVPLALHLIKADREAIEEAKSLLEAVKSGHSSLLRKVTYLAYGSLVYKFCSTMDFCPEEALQPLHDLLSEATETMKKEDIILALKTLGNAGQVVCIKRIMKYIPRFSSMTSTLPLPVQAAAVKSLRNIALKHPTKVLDICLQLYMDSTQHPRIRMLAARLIMDNKPPAATVMTVAKSLVKEGDMHVGSFVYSLMKRQSKCVLPDLQDVAAVCNMAVTILKSKYGATANAYHSGFHYDAYSDSLVSGIESSFDMIHNPADFLPVAALGRLKAYFMGVFTDLFEISYHAEGLQELLMNRHLFSQNGLQNLKKSMEMLKKLHDWKPLSSSESLASVDLRFLGHEMFYYDLNKNSLESIFKFLPSGKYSTLRSAVNALQNGVDINWSKPLLSSESRLLVPTCLGLPLETSLYYASLTRAQLRVQTHITPEPTDPSFIQLLQSNVNLKSKFSVSMAKDIVFMIGVNSDLVQAGMELRTKVNMELPGNVEAAVNVNQNHFRIDYIPAQQENEVLSIRSKAFVLTRNAEDLAAARMTPVVAAGTEPNLLKRPFNPRELSAGDAPRSEVKFAEEVSSKENTYWSDQPHTEAYSRDFAVCARTSHFGFQVCMEKNSLTAGFARNCPLYHVIGEHSFNLTVKPAHIDASVEKIRIEFQAGPGAAMKMVRSVNVRKTDGETHGLENPIDYMALSKLKKILVNDDVKTNTSKLENITSITSGHNSSSSENITESSKNSSSSAISRPASHQEKKHHKQQDKSREAHGHHEKEEHEHKDYQNGEEGIEIHCKCWPEKLPKQHEQMEDDERREQRRIHHETHENKNPHKDSNDEEHHQAGHHRIQEPKSRHEVEEHQHHLIKQKEQRDNADDHRHPHETQHGKKEQEGHHTEKHPRQTDGHHESKGEIRSCTCKHRPKENNNRKQKAKQDQTPHKDRHDRKYHSEEDRSPRKDHRDRKHHSEEDQSPRKDHHDRKHYSEEDQSPRKDHHDRKPHAEEDQRPREDHRGRKHQDEEGQTPHKDRQDGKHHDEEYESPHKDHSDRKPHEEVNQRPRKDHRGRKHQDEEDHTPLKDHHDRKHHAEEDKSPHKDDHDRMHHAEVDQRPRKGNRGRKHQDEEDETPRKDHHDEGDESPHKVHHDRKPHDKEDQRPRKNHHDRKHYDEEDEVVHKDHHGRKPHSEEDQRPRKNDHDRKHYDEEDESPHKDHRDRKQHAKEEQSPHKDHDSRSHHSQEHSNKKNHDEKCKFLSSESVQQSKKNKEHHAKNSGKNMEEANPRKGLKNPDNKKAKSTSKHWEKNISGSDGVSQRQKKDSKNTQGKHWKTIRKSDKTKFEEAKNMSQEYQYKSPSRKSQNYLELFAPQIHTAKFWSTTTLLSSQRSVGSSGSSSSSSSGSSSSSSSISSSSSSSGIHEVVSRRTSPNVFLLVKSVLSNGQHQGFQTTAYIDPDKLKAQVVTVPLDPQTSWMTCLDASISGSHKASAMLRWGQNCKDYRVISKFSTGELAGSPAVQLLWQWKSLPTWMKSVAGSVMAFAPSVAYIMGFSEMYHLNPSRQVTVRVAATSPDTYDAILKTPELTFYKQAVPVPWDLSLGTHWRRHLQLIELTNLPKVSSMVAGTHGDQCKVDLQNIVTFDGRKLGCSLSSTSCYTVIAQDCTDQLRFLITMKKIGQGFSTFEMNVKLGSYDIKIYSDSSEDFRVLLNGMWLLLKNDTYTNEKDCIRIHRNATTVTVKAPKNGVEQVAFSGHAVKVQLTPLMLGKTCGLCGNADHYQKNDFQKPNHETARSCNGLVHSWTVPDNSGGSSCALGWQYIMLENELIEERQSTCYSAEPVLNCVKGCHPAAAVPITVAFHCLPKESAVRLEDWQANPKASSEDLIKEVEAHTSCVCAEESAKI